METIDMSWGECERALDSLIKKLQSINYTPERIVALEKGGLVPAALLLQTFPEANFESFRTIGYIKSKAIGQVWIHLKLKINEATWDNPGTLVIDDICDTGSTFKKVHEYLPSAMYASMVSRAGTLFTGHLYGLEVPQAAWVNFPWECSTQSGEITPAF